MRVQVLLAFRYVFSKKKTNAINIISGITVSAFAVGTCAMIIVLSALNGFESTLTSLFTAFDPELKVETVKGKNFIPDSVLLTRLRQTGEVKDFAMILEDNAVLKYGSAQEIAVVKGVSDNYNRITQIDCTLVEGSFLLGNTDVSGGVFGYELAGKLGLNLSNPVGFVTVYAPRKGETDPVNPEQNVHIDKILPTGKFFVQEEIDSRYVLVSLQVARQLFENPQGISALEISVNNPADIGIAKSKIEKILGPGYTVKNRYEQKESIYKIFESEKLATFSILSFILLIAAFNMAGALTMLTLEKKPDIRILRSFGMSDHQIKQTFTISGLIISAMGSLTGLLLGGIICYLQIRFGIVRIENSIVEAYPMTLHVMDFVWVGLVSLLIGIITAWIPSRNI